MAFNPKPNAEMIESDRRSNVSSFYQGRRDSFDALGGAADPTPRERRDSSSSFFQPDPQSNNRFSRTSGDMLMSQAQVASAGYNRQSYFDPGREMPVRGGRDEEENVGMGTPVNRASRAFGRPAGAAAGYAPAHIAAAQEDEVDPGWDVYNDFNNTGPRYGDALGSGLGSLNSTDAGYRQIPLTSPSLPPRSSNGSLAHIKNQPSGDDTVELVTVPALGADWKRSEIENMRKSTKRAEKIEERKHMLKAWWRDQYACCGGFGTRKIIVIMLFVLCCLIGIALAITIPRVPSFTFDAANPLSAAPNVTNSGSSNSNSDGPNTDPPTEFSRTPANFSFPALLNFQVGTQSNVIPLHLKSIHVDLFDLNTNVPIGSGDFGSKTFPAKALVPITVPIVFNYTATNDTDLTWLDFYNACRNSDQYADGVRPGFDLQVVLTSSIRGLIKKATTGLQITKLSCPFELLNDSV